MLIFRLLVLFVVLAAVVLAPVSIEFSAADASKDAMVGWVGFAIGPDGNVVGRAYADKTSCEAERVEVEAQIARSGAPFVIAERCYEVKVRVPKLDA